MRILTVDIGTGTQDIFLYDSRLDLENGFKLVVPSPTMMVHQRLKEATRDGQAVLLSGVMMGGGPSGWAAEAHAKAGLPIYATPEAARTLNDDLDEVGALGIQIVSEDEAARLPEDVLCIELRDFDFPAIRRAFEPFGVSLADLDAVAVAVFDHGDAPPGVSDRQFRFDYLDERIRARRSVARGSAADRPAAHSPLSAFAFPAGEIPPIMTRLQAVAASAQGLDAPLVVMDTAPAAVLGATFDPIVAAQDSALLVNIGNFHTLAFRLAGGEIEGVFEHHTGLLDAPKLEGLLRALAAGTLEHEQVFGDHGHGALLYTRQALDLDAGCCAVSVTGPRRNLLRGSALRPHFAVPFGDMMIAGCFGLLAAVGDVLPEVGEQVWGSLRGTVGSAAPWDG